MSSAQTYLINDSPRGMWAVITMKDGLAYEGVVVDDKDYGVCIAIGGDEDRLNIFPWVSIIRMSLKEL